MSAIFLQRLIGPLVILGIYRHVHRMLTSLHIKDWCDQSWNMVVQFGTPKVDKKAMIRNRYNRIPHPALNTKRESTPTIKTALK